MASQSLDYFIEFIKGLKELDKKEKDILVCRLRGKKLQKIGKDYKITGERIRQIEKKALRKLKNTICQLRLID